MENASINNQKAQIALAETRTKHAEIMERLRCLNYKAHTVKTHAKADRSGPLLAWLIRQENPRQPVVAIQTSMGHTVHTQREIHTEFVQHYATLYQSHLHGGMDDIISFLESVSLPQVDLEVAE